VRFLQAENNQNDAANQQRKRKRFIHIHPPLIRLKRPATLNDTDQNQDDRHDEEDVNESSDGVAAHQSEQPGNDQN
jgi:hypothetical protein